jgi:hypothetical protein
MGFDCDRLEVDRLYYFTEFLRSWPAPLKLFVGKRAGGINSSYQNPNSIGLKSTLLPFGKIELTDDLRTGRMTLSK